MLNVSDWLVCLVNGRRIVIEVIFETPSNYSLTDCFFLHLCSTLRLVDVKDIKRRPEALELAVFQNIVMKHIEIARETLIKKYVSCYNRLYVRHYI